jgi:flagellar biosynthesis protein
MEIFRKGKCDGLMASKGSKKMKKMAVALKYEVEEDRAPKILALGEGWVADQIIKIAEAHDIPVESNPDLAESLAELECGSEIPPELYDLVAEVIWFVHRLDEKWKQQVLEKVQNLEKLRKTNPTQKKIGGAFS